MDPLATRDDIEDRLGRGLAAAESARVDALLVDASATVRSYTGQQFTQDETTARLRVRRGRVRLPQRPVNEVSEVADVDGNEVTFTWDHGQFVEVPSRPVNWFEINLRRTPLQWVDVAYDHGDETVPDDVVAVVCGIVMRSLGISPTDVGYQSESIDGYSYSVGVIAAAGAVGLLPGERTVLDRYRLAGGSVLTSP